MCIRDRLSAVSFQLSANLGLFYSAVAIRGTPRLPATGCQLFSKTLNTEGTGEHGVKSDSIGVPRIFRLSADSFWNEWLMGARLPKLQGLLLCFSGERIAKVIIVQGSERHQVVERGVAKRSCFPSGLEGFLAADLGESEPVGFGMPEGKVEKPIGNAGLRSDALLVQESFRNPD